MGGGTFLCKLVFDWTETYSVGRVTNNFDLEEGEKINFKCVFAKRDIDGLKTTNKKKKKRKKNKTLVVKVLKPNPKYNLVHSVLQINNNLFQVCTSHQLCQYAMPYFPK